MSEKKPTVTTADGLYSTTKVCTADIYATTSTQGRGRGFRGGRSAATGRGAQSTRGRGKPPGTGTPSAGPPQGHSNEGTGQNPSSNPQSGQNSLPKQGAGYNLLPCIFCGQQQHPARSCPQYMKPDTVYLKAVEALLCLNCLRMGHYASSCPHPGCSMEGCNARHHKLLHGHNNPTRRNH